MNAQEIKEEYQGLTSNKTNNAIKTFIADELSVLLDRGFSDPLIKDNSWVTTFDWLSDDIAIEVEVDWRDIDIFMLLVRLEDGKLPKGYYVSGGKPCRYHLQKVITDRKWNVDKNAFGEISPGRKSSRQSKNLSTDALKKRFQQYKTVLLSCFDQLIEDRQNIFP